MMQHHKEGQQNDYKNTIECNNGSIKAMGGSALLIGAGTTGPRADEHENRLQSTESTTGKAHKAF